MFKNNLKIAWRNLLKDRQFAFLNLIGLASGLACVLLIYLWVSDELNFDQFHKNRKQIYEVMQNVPLADGGLLTMEFTPDHLAKALTDEIPEVKETVVIKSPDADGSPKGILSANNSGIKASELYVTPNFFNVFSYHLIKGNKNELFPNHQSVLLSSAMAVKLFHNTQNIVGKMVKWDRGTGGPEKLNGTYMVSGIFEAPPANSTTQFDLLFSNALYAENIRHNVNWLSSSQSTYVVLKDGTDDQLLNKKIKNFIRSKFKAGDDGLKWAGTLFLQRYSDKYLYNRYENGAIAGGRIEYIKLFSIIAIFILVIACINFMNLSTAKASRRIKEVGIKKVVGAGRWTLIFQYITESVLMSLLALVIAVGLVWLMLPAFKEITGKNLSLNFSTGFVSYLILMAVVTGVISGSYPALYLSGFRPAAILKGQVNASGGESIVRKILVVFQFTISIVLIVSVMVVYRQMKLIQTKNLGYNKDHIINFPNDGKLQQNEQAFLTDAKTIPGVVNATDMEGDMLGNHSGGGGIDWEGKTHRIEFSGLYADYDFMETMGLKTSAGRPFSRKFGSDTSGVIFNETAIAEMGIKDPIGKIVKLWGQPEKIIGVVKDFHFESLYKKVGPFFLSYRKNAANLVIKLRAGTEKETIARLAALYKKYNPGLPFEYKFLDDDYQALYASEQRVAVLSRYFAGIAIIISCLGLFGLAAFTAQKRQKEIGIRKVIGASVSNVVVILSKDFLKLVFIAILVAFPLAWWTTSQWLHSFAYRINIGAGIFLAAGASTIIITLITISYQAIKAALMNPVKSLKSE
jgi:ABC-type antimicrobial peptide transport system permease subunit